jgi:hypothetical protein
MSIKTPAPHGEQIGPTFRALSVRGGKSDCSFRSFGGVVWLFYRHPDGQWVTLREATELDLASVIGAASDERDKGDAPGVRCG